jgi:hypothetical protein
VVTNDPSLLAYQIRIPKVSFIRLFFLEYNYYLKKEKGYIIDKLRILIKKAEVSGEESLDHIDDFIDWFFINSELKQRLIILNRVPSLWRFSTPIVEVIGVNAEDIISVSPMIITGLNMDFDKPTVEPSCETWI